MCCFPPRMMPAGIRPRVPRAVWRYEQPPTAAGHRWPACHPWPGADRAHARRPGRTVASLLSVPPGPAVPPGSGHTAVCCAAGQLAVTDLTCRARWALDEAGRPARALPGPRAGQAPDRQQCGAAGHRPGPRLSGPYRPRPAVSLPVSGGAGWLEAAVSGGGGGRRELDQVAGAERASVRHRAARRAAPVGGSNRLLSVEEVAAHLGVPKKTVYGCWRAWGLRGYRVGRCLRFRERHVEEWLQSRSRHPSTQNRSISDPTAHTRAAC